MYDEYDIKDGETPEIIAEKLYGNPLYHWILMIVNERYNHFKDFPLSGVELYNLCIEKYSEERVHYPHHFESDDGVAAEAIAMFNIPDILVPSPDEMLANSPLASLMKPSDFLLVGDYTRARLSQVNYPYEPTAELMVSTGRFEVGNQCVLRGVRHKVFKTIATFTLPNNSYTRLDNLTTISNYDYEERINEAKRRIKVVAPGLINQILEEYRDLMQL
jgi:hypothetical protein